MRFNRFISYLFHPISFPTLWTVFYLISFPGYMTVKKMELLLLIVSIGTFLLPLTLLFFLKKLYAIDSLQLKTLEERKTPLLANAFMAFLIGRMLLRAGHIRDLAFFLIAGGLALLLVYLCLYCRQKISLHTLGLGSIIGAVLNLSYQYKTNYLLGLALLFILLGLLAKSRLDLKAHTQTEVILGAFLGIASQVLLMYIH